MTITSSIYRKETFFSVDIGYLCVLDSKFVPNPVITIYFRREKRLRSPIGSSHGLCSTDPLSRACGSGKLTSLRAPSVL